MFLGYLLGKTKLFPEGAGAAKSLSTFVWYVAIPALFFKLMASNSLPNITELSWVVTYYICLYIVYFSAYLIIAPLIGIPTTGRGVFAFTTCFGNIGFIGISIVQQLFGDEGIRQILLIISFHMVSLMLVSVLLTEISKTSRKRIFTIVGSTGLALTKNPIIVTLFISVAWSASGLGIPQWVMRLIELPAASAAPVGLFAVGLSLSRVPVKGIRLQAFSALAMKLILLPILVYVSFRWIIQADSMAINLATIAACMPTGMAAYTFAQQMDYGEKATAATILIGTLLSMFTLTIALSFLV